MTPLWQLVAVIAEILRWLSAPPVSLADAAWREAVRREIVGRSVTAYTNATLAAVPETTDVGREAPAPPVPSPEELSEATWRRRVRQLVEAIEQNRRLVSEAEAHLALLESQAVSRDDPAQQALLRQQAREARESLSALLRKVAAGDRALAALLDEARRLGIPPGWLR
jgi:hypothetical protein